MKDYEKLIALLSNAAKVYLAIADDDWPREVKDDAYAVWHAVVKRVEEVEDKNASA